MLSKEYNEKENIMVRIIMESGGIDSANENGKGEDVVREYLKNKENELMEMQQNQQQQLEGAIAGSKLKEKKTAKQQLKKDKESNYNQSKT